MRKYKRMQKLFLSSLFAMLIVSEISFAQSKALLLQNNFDGKNFVISEGKMIKIFTKNHLTFEGNFSIINDSIIELDNFRINISTISTIQCHKYSKAQTIAGGVFVIGGGLMGIASVSFFTLATNPSNYYVNDVTPAANCLAGIGCCLGSIGAIAFGAPFLIAQIFRNEKFIVASDYRLSVIYKKNI